MSSYHGWTHAPKSEGGTDPIPGALVPNDRQRNVHYSIAGAEWKFRGLFDTGPTGITRTVDTSAPFGGYIELNGDGEYVVFGMPLGPRYSVWATYLSYRTLTDGGIITFDWQTTPVDSDLNGTFGEPYPEVVEGPQDPSTTYYYVNDSSPSTIDTYSPTPGDFFNTAAFNPLQVAGEDGAMLSAHGTAGGTYNADSISERQMNGGGDGSVMWWQRVRVNGKNGASSGYKARIYYIGVSRITGSYGWPVM